MISGCESYYRIRGCNNRSITLFLTNWKIINFTTFDLCSGKWSTWNTCKSSPLICSLIGQCAHWMIWPFDVGLCVHHPATLGHVLDGALPESSEPDFDVRLMAYSWLSTCSLCDNVSSQILFDHFRDQSEYRNQTIIEWTFFHLCIWIELKIDFHQWSIELSISSISYWTICKHTHQCRKDTSLIRLCEKSLHGFQPGGDNNHPLIWPRDEIRDM